MKTQQAESLLNRTKRLSGELVDALHQLSEHEAELSEYSTARLENIREAELAAEDCREALQCL